MNFKDRQKLRHGSAAFAVAAVVIAAVILLNAALGALFSGKLWFLDLTSEGMYTLTPETRNMLKGTFEEANAKREQNGEDPVKVDIIFCADPDMLTANEKMRYIYYTALDLQKKFPDTVRVSSTNVWANPSAVDAYRTNAYSAIYQSNVIIASGTEFRINTIRNFYTYNSDTDEEPWAYSGEKRFVSSIIAVTRAEAPICGVTVNHGEPFATEEGRAQYSALLNVIDRSGYDVRYLDLEKDEIPEDCRLILTFDPKTDFVSSFQSEGRTSEISKLDRFLGDTYSFVVFFNADTPVLTNLEEFLEEWGISFDRYADPNDPDTVLGNYRIVSESAVDQAGLSLIGAYAESGTGAGITKNMRERGGSPKVVFGNAMSVSYSDSYEQTFVLDDAENNIKAFSYGSYFRNNRSRAIFDVFNASERSTAHVVSNGAELTDAEGNPVLADTRGGYQLMTITRESRTIGEGQGYTTVNDSSYVCAFGSTEFASNEILLSNSYGNTDVLLETLRTIGREVEPVGLSFKPMYEGEMTAKSTESGESYYTELGNRITTVILCILPAVTFLTLGTVLLVRRKQRT